MDWYVDRKYTVWERSYYEGTEEQFNKFVEEMKDEDTIEPSGDTFRESEFVYDTLDLFPLEDNKGSATIEIYKVEDNDTAPWQSTVGELVYDNSIKTDE